jgi:hypothetical protein
MGLIREPLDVDFYVDPRPLTKKEQEMISRHIREYKAKMTRQLKRKANTMKKLITAS